MAKYAAAAGQRLCTVAQVTHWGRKEGEKFDDCYCSCSICDGAGRSFCASQYVIVEGKNITAEDDAGTTLVVETLIFSFLHNKGCPPPGQKSIVPTVLSFCLSRGNASPDAPFTEGKTSSGNRWGRTLLSEAILGRKRANQSRL